MWLDRRNIKTYHPTTKLAPKRHGPFPIKKVLSTIDYQLTLPEQWKIHNVFHIDLLTPYRETEFHGPNYNRPPPDLVGEEEQYEVEQVLDERNYGRWKKKQYLVKWKGYPDLDNQWLDAKDMENAQELIAEFHNSNNKLCSHIKRALGHLHFSHPLSSVLPSISTSISDASHSTNHATIVEENTDPLPVPPHKVTPDVTIPSVLVQVPPIRFVCIRDTDFPHPNEPTPSELNDSDQENIAPPVQAVPCVGPTIHTPLGRTQVSIPFSEDVATNQAILTAITRVHNTVDRGDTYIAGIEEIIQIARTLRHRGLPSEDDEAAALVAQLHQIRQLESRSEPSSPEAPAPTDVTFPTPTIPRNLQVTASTASSRTQVCAVASGPTSPQQPHT